MSIDPKPTDNDKKKRSSSDTARRIWLAGIGAYGRAFTEAQEALKDVTGKSSDVFDELVQKGEMLEIIGKTKGKEILDKAAVPDLHIDDRIARMRERLSRGGGMPDAAAVDMNERLDILEAKVDKVLALLEPKKKIKKSSSKRATTTRIKKTPVKK